MSLGIHRGALAEIAKAVAHYRAIDQELADDLAAALKERLVLAERVPGASRIEPNAPARFELRWYRLRRFPYSLLIGLVRGKRRVIAFAHAKRKPGYWKERLE
jgi:hypothetical protein